MEGTTHMATDQAGQTLSPTAGRGNPALTAAIKEVIAERYGIELATLSAVEKIKKKGIPALLEAAGSDRVSIKLAAQICEFGVTEQAAFLRYLPEKGEAKLGRELRALKKTVKKETIEAALAAQRNTGRIAPVAELADAMDWLEKRCDESVDLMITDPPHSTDVDDIEVLVDSWLLLALRKIKRTGSAYIFIGSSPNEQAAYLKILHDKHVFDVQLLVRAYKTNPVPDPRKFYTQNWQMILLLRGPKAPKLTAPNLIEQFSVQHCDATDGYPCTGSHTWQRPYRLAEAFVRHASKEGDLVLDPFMGTGTFLLAAGRLGRRAEGCDHDVKMIEVAREQFSSTK